MLPGTPPLPSRANNALRTYDRCVLHGAHKSHLSLLGDEATPLVEDYSDAFAPTAAVR